MHFWGSVPWVCHNKKMETRKTRFSYFRLCTQGSCGTKGGKNDEFSNVYCSVMENGNSDLNFVCHVKATNKFCCCRKE